MNDTDEIIINEHDVVELNNGIKGTIVHVWNPGAFIIEYKIDEDTFTPTIELSDIKKVCND